MIQQAIHTVINGKDLDYNTARATMEEMMDGTATDIEMATLLTALRMKGETITEITACAEIMREKGTHINPRGAVMEIVGTGGDEVGSFNISTTSAFVVAAGGVPVAKHGNRSVSSRSGAADVLEELGAEINLSPAQNEHVLAETGICFLFAQGYHKSMKNVAPVRKGMRERTLFNILGPLSNPARASMQLLGVYDENLIMPMAQVLSNLGVTRGMVVCGDGMDEASLAGNILCGTIGMNAHFPYNQKRTRAIRATQIAHARVYRVFFAPCIRYLIPPFTYIKSEYIFDSKIQHYDKVGTLLALSFFVNSFGSTVRDTHSLASNYSALKVALL